MKTTNICLCMRVYEEEERARLTEEICRTSRKSFIKLNINTFKLKSFNYSLFSSSSLTLFTLDLRRLAPPSAARFCCGINSSGILLMKPGVNHDGFVRSHSAQFSAMYSIMSVLIRRLMLM